MIGMSGMLLAADYFEDEKSFISPSSLCSRHSQVGLKIYNSVNPNPVRVIYEEGDGVSNTDMILYVQAVSTARCVRDKVVAYAKHCQQDQFQRPIAGYANFCPVEFLASDIPFAIKTAIHELIHVLGMFMNLRCVGLGGG